MEKMNVRKGLAQDEIDFLLRGEVSLYEMHLKSKGLSDEETFFLLKGEKLSSKQYKMDSLLRGEIAPDKTYWTQDKTPTKGTKGEVSTYEAYLKSLGLSNAEIGYLLKGKKLSNLKFRTHKISSLRINAYKAHLRTRDMQDKAPAARTTEKMGKEA